MMGSAEKALATTTTSLRLNPYHFSHRWESCGQFGWERGNYRKAAEYFRRGTGNQPEPVERRGHLRGWRSRWKMTDLKAVTFVTAFSPFSFPVV